MNSRIVRIDEAAEYTGQSKRKLYERAKDKTFPQPIKLGPRRSGYYLDELDRMNRAAAAGLSEEAQRRLVKQIERERTQALDKTAA